MAVDKNKIAGDCWKRGTEALGKQNWDYAIEMFRQASKFVSDNLLYRETLRGAEEKKFGNNGTGARLANAKLMGVRGKIKKSRMTKNWEQVDSLAEDGLAINPWDAALNIDLGDACTARAEAAVDAGNESLASGFQSIGIFAYSRALKVHADSKPLNRSLAYLYEARRDYRAAIACWERIHRIDPLDAEARSKSSQLAAESTIDHANFDDAQSTRDVMADHEIAKRLGTGQAVDGPGMSAEADMHRAIRKEPENADNYLKLADFYVRVSKLSEAEELLRKALELSGDDPNIKEKLEDVELDQLRKYVTESKNLAKNKPGDPSLKQRAISLETELVKREIEIFTAREKRYPSDMRLKLELAQRLARFKKWQLAIPLLQRAVTDTRVRGEALVRLGICFIGDKKPQLARHQLEQATSEVDHELNPKMYKEMLYLLGTICESAGDIPDALKHYSTLLSVDYGYKDAVKRLENLQSGNGSR